MKNEASFSLKDKSKKLKCRLLQFLFGALRVNIGNCNLCNVYLQKISGRELKYTALVGKPSELTYQHADYLLHEQAKSMGMDGVKTLYCIG